MNQRKLDHEVKTLQVQAAQFAKQTGQWIGMVENFNQALKVGHTPYIRGTLLTASRQVSSRLSLKRKWGCSQQSLVLCQSVREVSEKLER